MNDLTPAAAVVHLPVWPADVPVHPAAELFPLMTGTDFAELVKDVHSNGLLQPIVRTQGGQILDGRNRYRACVQAGVEPTYAEHAGEPWRYVISTNLHRRHLTDSQRATIAAKIAERAVGKRAPFHDPEPSPYGEASDLPPSREQAAELLNVSPRQVDRARQVIKHGTESLKAAVESGAVPVATAARVANELPADEQDEFVEKVSAGQDPRRVAPAPKRPPITDAELAELREAEVRPRIDQAARRRPIADSADDLGWEMRKAAEKLSRLLADDRFTKNEEQVALSLRGHLLFVAETVATALNKLGN